MGNPRESHLRLNLLEGESEQKHLNMELETSRKLLKTKYFELQERENDLAAVNLKLSETIVKLDQSNLALAKRTAELEKSNEELRAAVKQRADFLAALSHDLKNPVLAATRILEMFFTGRLKCEAGSPILSQLIESNRNILRMIWNLLDLYRNDLHAPEPIIEDVDIEELIKEGFFEFSFVAAQKHLELKILMDHPIRFGTDKVLLRRILINLLDNAIRFSPYASIVIVEAEANPDGLKIIIRDSGPGMSEDELSVLFERFSQAKTSRNYSGSTGLGLYACRQIADLLGGTLKCNSVQGQGTEFTLTLPIKNPTTIAKSGNLVEYSS
jgi:signal transduction histidine kinase